MSSYIDKAIDLFGTNAVMILGDEESSEPSTATNHGTGPNGDPSSLASWSESDGPGGGLVGYWDVRPTNARIDFGLDSAWDITGELGIIYFVRRNGEQTTWATHISKGDDTYQVRQSGSSDTTMQFDVRGGTGGTEEVVGGDVPNAVWQALVAKQTETHIELYQYNRLTDELELQGQTPRDGTIGTNSISHLLIGVQDNDGELRRSFDGDIAGAVIVDGPVSSLEAEELIRVAFPDPHPSKAGNSTFAGTNEEGTFANQTIITNYEHTGGQLLVFARTGPLSDPPDMTITATFGGQSILLQASDHTDDAPFVAAFGSNFAESTGDIVVSYSPDAERRGVHVISVPDASGVRAVETSTIGISTESIHATVNSEPQDLVIGYTGWFASGDDVIATGTDHTIIENDDDPTRQISVERPAEEEDTQTNVDIYWNDNSGRAVLIVASLEMEGFPAPTNLTTTNITTTSARANWTK